MAKPVRTTEEEVARIERVLTAKKGTHTVDSLTYPVEALATVIDAAEERGVLDNAAKHLSPDELLSSTLILSALDNGRFRLVALPSQASFFSIPQIAEYAYAALVAAARRNCKNIDIPISRLQAPIGAVMGKLSEQVYNILAPQILGVLAKKNARALSILDKGTLRACLKSKTAAAAQAPTIPDTVWEKILDTFIVVAKQNGLDPLIFEDWKMGRQVVVETIADEELPDLSGFADEVEARIIENKAKKAAKAAKDAGAAGAVLDGTAAVAIATGTPAAV